MEFADIITGSSTQINDGSENSDISRDIPDFFKNLHWNVVEGSEYNSCMTNFLPCEEDNVTKSHALTLVHSQRYPFPEKEFDIKDIIHKGSCDYYVPGVQGRTIVYPRHSELSYKEQNLLYSLSCRIQFNYPSLNQSEWCQYQELMKKIKKEHSEFQQFVALQWIRQHCRRCMEIPDSVQEFINKLWKGQVKQCLALYPHLYKIQSDIPLMLNDPNKDHSVMELIKVVTLRGRLQTLSFPKLDKPNHLITDLNTMCQIKQFSLGEEGPAVKPITISVQPASVDPVVDVCIKIENIDVVMTPSSIKTIVDVYQHQKDWILPVTVKNVLKVSGELNKKVVIIDKKLPPSAMSVHDKNVKHAKIFSKWTLVLNSVLNSANKDQGSKKRKLVKYDDNLEAAVEEFRVDVASSAISCKANVDSQLLTAATKKEKDNYINDISNNISENDKETKEANNELEHHNCIRHLQQKYAIWELHKSTHFNMSKQEQRSLKVLVRSRVDGKMSYLKNSPRGKVHSASNMFVSSKLEYQPEYGAYKMNKSEVVREYVDLFVRETNLCRVRVVGHTKELMSFEIKTLQEIKDCLQHVYMVETHKVFDPLYAVLTKLIDLPVGRYLLRHSPKMQAFSQLLSESAEHIHFNLTNHCERLETTEVYLPASEIDPLVLTRVHFRERQPPALFRVFNSAKAKFFKKPPLGVKKKHRKKRKGGKKQSFSEGNNTPGEAIVLC